MLGGRRGLGPRTARSPQSGRRQQQLDRSPQRIIQHRLGHVEPSNALGGHMGYKRSEFQASSGGVFTGAR